MPQKHQVRLAGMKVGIFVAVGLLILSILILQQSWGVDWFSDDVGAITYLPDVGGLKPGAPVWLAGIEIGQVREVKIVPPEVYSGNAPVFRQIAQVKKEIESLDPKQPNYRQLRAELEEDLRDFKTELRFVQVKMDIRTQYINRISDDSEVSIESRGLIGDSFIDISPGTYGVPPPKQGEYYVIRGVKTAGFREIMTGANDVVANFGVLSEQFRNIAQKINPEQVGEGVNDTLRDVRQALRQADNTFTRATALMEDLRSGEGTIGRLVSDPELYRRLNASLEKFNSIADRIQTGPGTLSKLINDPSLFNNARDTLRKADVMMDRIEKGEGTLGRLSKDEALYDTTKQTLAKLSRMVDGIDKGEGTMGRLLRDPGLYNNLNQSTAEITKLIYDLRQDPKKYLTIRFRLF